jgi:hypothetical protein
LVTYTILDINNYKVYFIIKKWIFLWHKINESLNSYQV